MKFPVPYYVRLKFTRKWVYLRVEKGALNNPLISIDSRCVREEFPYGLNLQSTERIAQMLADQIKSRNPPIPKLHLDVQYEMIKKREEHHQNILVVADVLQRNGLRIAGYG